MRTLLVTKADQKQFKITVADDARITFGPFSPPPKGGREWGQEEKAGTVRIYDGKNIVAVFSQVSSFRDLAIGFSEQVAVEEGATIWKDDKDGYVREEKVAVKKEWIDEPPLLSGEVKVVRKKRKS